MLEHARNLKGFGLKATDGEIGSVKDFLFDDRFWAIRYLVADTGNWLTGTTVLLSPYALHAVDKEARAIVTILSRHQIEGSPSLEHDLPVSRQFEQKYNGYYGWPAYYDGPYMWGNNPYFNSDRKDWASPAVNATSWNPHLRSMQEVDGYHLQARDGEIGHVEDFIIDTDTWAVRYLVVDTQNWWPGKRILLSPHWIERVRWEDSKVFVRESRERIKAAPEFTEGMLLTREYEAGLHRHYDTAGYWADETAITTKG
jgi:hypothetical protein